MPGLPRGQRECSMKKVDMVNDDLRPEYRREDFGAMVRGKYAARLQESSNIVVLDPEIAEAFPNTKAVNDALRGLLELARVSARLPAPSGSTSAPAPIPNTHGLSHGRSSARFAIMGGHSRRGGAGGQGGAC